MQVFDRFMDIADEMTGIPKYMTGQHVPGAGRTSSGLSMLISNAGKSIKQVIGNIDHDVLKPMLERQYQRNLRYSEDPDLIGDVQIIARGATVIGHWPTNGYEFDESKALTKDKQSFVGLGIDDDCQNELSDERLEQWCLQVSSEFK